MKFRAKREEEENIKHRIILQRIPKKNRMKHNMQAEEQTRKYQERRAELPDAQAEKKNPLTEERRKFFSFFFY